jgi:hypothetical protein
MDPLHVVRFAGDALDRCLRRIQQIIHGHRGRASDPRYRGPLNLHTGIDLLTHRQRQRLEQLFADDAHAQVKAAWGIHQRMIADYRQPDWARRRELMVNLIDTISKGVPEPLTELITLGRTLKKAGRRRTVVLRPTRLQQRSTEAINGRLEHLRGSAPRLPQPHQLHRPMPTRSRRVQTSTTSLASQGPYRFSGERGVKATVQARFRIGRRFRRRQVWPGCLDEVPA